MKAVTYTQSPSVDLPEALQDVSLPAPALQRPHDLLVRVAAVSVNPVDTKIRRNRAPQGDQPGVLGWDAVGIVEAVSPAVAGFKPRDRVFYAGAIDRPGCNSELHVVDARIVGHAPASLNDAQAAALPLTTLTAWELLFDRLGVPRDGGQGQSLLIVGGAGGVGSILTQLARRLTRLRVIATASRPESTEWVKAQGAHAVIDHTQAFVPQLQAQGGAAVDFVISLTHTAEHLDDIAAALAPQGRLAMIDDFGPLDITKFKGKSISLHWESMFTRSLFETPDIARQGEILNELARLVDAGTLRTTHAETLGPINATKLRLAHARLEAGRVIGKLVLVGF